MDKALSGIRVLDLSRVFAGPWATQNLADLGAEVIKVERPGAGDDTRSWGPPFLRDAEGKETRDSSYFLAMNRGKRSITLDIAAAEGQRIVRELVKSCDVLVENYKVGNLARFGLDYESLSALNPRLVYCSVTGFGQDGPYGPQPGYDFVFQGMGGLMSMTGHPDGMPGGGPMKTGIAIGDAMGGMYATTAILAALQQRHATGRGQYIDISLLDCVVALTSYMSMNYFVEGRLPRRLGNAHANITPYQVFRCKEGDVILGVGNDSQYASFCGAIGRPELATDPRFATGEQRVRHRGELIPVLEQEFLQRTMAEWVELLNAHGVPCGPINTLKEVFEDPQVRHRGLRISMPHSAGVQAPGVASPLRLSESPVSYELAPPMLGEHTEQVLSDLLGMTGSDIAALRERKII